MEVNKKYKGYKIWIRKTHIGCHGPEVFYCKIYKGEIKMGTHVHATEYQDEHEEALQDAKDWIDEKEK